MSKKAGNRYHYDTVKTESFLKKIGNLKTLLSFFSEQTEWILIYLCSKTNKKNNLTSIQHDRAVTKHTVVEISRIYREVPQL